MHSDVIYTFLVIAQRSWNNFPLKRGFIIMNVEEAILRSFISICPAVSYS